jgi:hypothetical protein
MKTLPWIAAVLSVALTAPALAAEPNYRVVDHIKLPDGGFDYVTFDSAKGRVLIARTDFTSVIDAKTGKLSQLNSAAHGHMTIAIPGTTLLVLPEGAGKVRIADEATDMVLADIPAGVNPDGAAYDPYSKLVFAMSQRSGEAILVDPAARKVVATIAVGGTLEFPASDGAGKVFVNVTSVPEVAVIDVKTRMVAARYKLDGCKGATGLAYDPQAKLVISSCRNGLAKVLQADTGKEVASLSIGDGPDAVFFDPVRKLAFIPCGGDGVLEVISLADPQHISVVQHVPTQIGSRTGTVDPQSGRVYLMSAKRDPSATPPPGGRGAPRLAGSYEVLEVAP